MATKTIFHAFMTDLAPAESSAVPTFVQLLPASPFTGRDGRGPFAFEAQTLLDAFALNGKPLHIDYEHQSIGAADKTEPTPAAGWINTLVPAEDGTLWAEVEWTEKAAAYIASREYRYLSPVFTLNTKTGQIIALRGAGLTNDPNLYLQSLNSRESDRYTSQTTNSEEEMLQKILEVLGLTTDATEEAILAHVASLKTAAEKAAAVAAEVGADADADAAAIVQAAQSRFTTDLSNYVARDELIAMTHRAESAEAELKAMKEAAHTKACEDAVAEAIQAGKFTPAQSASLLVFAKQDLEMFKAFASSAPVLAVAQNSQLPNVDTSTKSPLTDEQRRILAAAGISEDEFVKVRNQRA